MVEVIVYTTPTCGYCLLVLRLLREKGAEIRQVDVMGDRKMRHWLAEVTGRHTVPQVFIGGRPYGGYTDLRELDRTGELDKLLRPVG